MKALPEVPVGKGSPKSALLSFRPEPTPKFTYPPEQLMGLKRPAGMLRDPETGHWALEPVMKAYWALQEKAKEDGWRLTLVSGYRSFAIQRELWNRRFRRAKEGGFVDDLKCAKFVTHYTSYPGLSRHHWGTDLDLGEHDLHHGTLELDEDPSARLADFYQWLEVNAPAYGFCRPYRGGRKAAIQAEPWHWSYQAIASPCQADFERIRDFTPIYAMKVEGEEAVWGDFERVYLRHTRAVALNCATQPGTAPPAKSATK